MCFGKAIQVCKSGTFRAKLFSRGFWNNLVYLLKRKYTSKSFSIKHLLEKQDRKVFRKVSGIDRHPLRGLLPKKKASTYNYRNRTSQYPKVNTDRFKNSYINRLIFKYNLAM